MQAFTSRDGQLFAEGVALSAIAERFGTPTYVYSRAHIEAQYRAYADALQGIEHLVCFAVKANSNLGVLNVLARLGAGFDIVSRGELERVLAAGGKPEKIVFSGVGRRPCEAVADGCLAAREIEIPLLPLTSQRGLRSEAEGREEFGYSTANEPFASTAQAIDGLTAMPGCVVVLSSCPTNCRPTDAARLTATVDARTIRAPRLTAVSDGKPLRRLLVTSKAHVVFVDRLHGTPPC